VEDEILTQPTVVINNNRNRLYIAFATILVVIIIIYGVNYIQLQSYMDKVIKDDIRNQEINVSVHYENYVNPQILIYDLKSVSNNNSMADVFRVFLQFSDSVKEKKFETVIIAYNGIAKFKLGGDYFNTIGKEYLFQNPVYTIRTFPEHLKKADGSQAYAHWTGGMLGVLQKQMDDFNNFHRQWYIEDMK
jgi:hypothetical protein